ncbi:MAG: hypothetical protein EKK53_21040 [Burkholderiales bacterium]|nr:MAG: hypothetical protein EKK53_21040 [Burkholderiales bacterium]
MFIDKWTSSSWHWHSQAIHCLLLILAFATHSSHAKEPSADKWPSGMPDGLYLTDDEYGFKPFLIVENGQWIDPYEWVKQHGIKALNERFTEGKRFERAHINAKVATINGLQLNETTLADILAPRGQTEWAGGVAPKKGFLASQISDQKCDRTPSRNEKWRCLSTVQTTWRIKCQSVSYGATYVSTTLAGHCLAAITLPESALSGFQWYPSDLTDLPKPERQRIEKQMNADFFALRLPVTQDKDFSSTNIVASFTAALKPDNHQLVAGTSFSKIVPGLSASLARHMAGTDLTANDWKYSNIGYLYDMRSQRYTYIRQPTVLNQKSQYECTKGGEGSSYCPASWPVGMVKRAGKVYTVWLEEQRIGTHYPGRKRCKDIEGSGTSCPGVVIKAVSYAVTEHDVKSWQSQEIYSTRPTLSVEQQY